jgi:hypothetical protein
VYQPVKEVYNLIMYEPMDEITRDYVQDWLDKNYPEAEWEVFILQQGSRYEELVIYPCFDNPKDETFYKLKWS